MPTLKKLREAAFLTQQDVAKELDVSTNTVYDWERGRNKPRLRYMPLLAKLYGVTPQQLRDIVEQNAPAKKDD